MTDSSKNSDGTVMRQVADIDLEQFALGAHSELLAFNGRVEACKLMTTMIDQASHQLIFFGRSLQTDLLGDSMVLNSVSALLRRNHSATLKTLVNQSHDLVKSGHRLVELLRHFMPAVECRIRRLHSSGFEGACVLVDRTGYVYLPEPDRYRGSASFNGIATVEKLYDEFTQEWQVAEPDPEIRPLDI